MCQYSSPDGRPTDWHFVHLGSRAVGGAGLVMVEATGVSPEGRISPGDTGIWSDDHRDAFAPIARFIGEQGAIAGIQIAHAGRKASTEAPWRGGRPIEPGAGGWETLAPSAVPFRPSDPTPREMSPEDIARVVEEFVAAARRSAQAGFKVVEVHMAHGYLLHEFLSPLTNFRHDDYGGDLAGRARLPLEVARRVRETFPADLPVFVRISATDWVEGGWDLEQSIQFAKWLKGVGVDLVDCSSGGAVPGATIPVVAGYQVPFAAAVRSEAGIATGAVGLIVEPHQAEQIVAMGQADAVFLARAMLRDPYWPLRAAAKLGAGAAWPKQYARAVD
jgi:2,4-dienoyl-CoA reductase-like NADH-dependent reductase (Old Yellow Enzyme family)